jgi:hypothetical protein
VATEGDERSVECTTRFALEVVSEYVVVIEPFRVTVSYGNFVQRMLRPLHYESNILTCACGCAGLAAKIYCGAGRKAIAKLGIQYGLLC